MVTLAWFAATARTQANLLANPGFEEGPAHGGIPAGWWTYAGCGQEMWAPRTGTNGVAFWSWNDGWWGGFGQDVHVALASNDVLAFSIWGRAEAYFRSSNSEAWMQIQFWTSAVDCVRSEFLDLYGALISRPDQWTRYTFTTTNRVPNVSIVKVLVGAGGFLDSGRAESVLWDDAELVRTPGHGFDVESSVDTNRAFRIGWSCTTSVYYQVWASEALDGNWRLIRGMALGTDSNLVWRDTNAIARFNQLYYKVVAISVTNAHDEDGDGLNDVTELRMGGVDPANADTDGDRIHDGVDPRPLNTNEAPVIQSVTLSSAANFHGTNAVSIAVSSADPDGDSAQYRYRVNPGAYTAWQGASPLTWTPATNDVGQRTLTVEARDAWGATNRVTRSTYVFRLPPAA